MIKSMTKVYIDGTETQRLAQPKKMSGDDRTATLLDYQLNSVILVTLVVFIILSILIGIDHEYSVVPACNVQVVFKDWVISFMAMAVGCAILACTLQVIRVASLLCLKSKMCNKPLIRVNIMLFVLCALSGSSITLTLLNRHGGICKDAIGVFSPAQQWVEWIVLVPLLIYIACALEQKTQMDWFDFSMISLQALMIITGFLLNLRIPFGLAVFFIVLSFLSLLIITVMTIVNYQHVTAHAPVKVRMSNYFSAKQTRRKAGLLMQLLIIIWYYPMVWILGAAQVLDVNFTFAAYMLGSIGKVIFSSLVIESHVTLLYEYLITTATSTNMGEDHLVDVTSPKTISDRRSDVILISPATDRYLKARASTMTGHEAGAGATTVGAIMTIPEEAQELDC